MNTVAYYNTELVINEKKVFGDRLHETQPNNTLHDDIQHNDTQHKGLIYDTQHK